MSVFTGNQNVYVGVHDIYLNTMYLMQVRFIETIQDMKYLVDSRNNLHVAATVRINSAWMTCMLYSAVLMHWDIMKNKICICVDALAKQIQRKIETTSKQHSKVKVKPPV